MKTEGLKIQFGKYNGELWTRVPASYLKWLANESTDAAGNLAKAELMRRGTVIDGSLDIAPHAIDRASLKLTGIYMKTRKDREEGLYTWLFRKANEALAESPGMKPTDVVYDGMKFVFKHGEYYPILITIMPRD